MSTSEADPTQMAPPLEEVDTEMPEQELFSDIFRRAQAGDEAAIATVWRRTSPSASFAIRETGGGAELDDLMQETAGSAFRYLPGWKIPEIEEAVEPSFKKWLSITAAHKTINMHRKNSRRVSTISYDAEDEETHSSFTVVHAAPADQEPENVLEEREGYEVVMDALQHVPEHFRSAVYAISLMKETAEDASDSLGVNINTVRTRNHRGRKALAKAILSGAAGEDLRQMAMQYPKAVEMLRELELDDEPVSEQSVA